MMFLLSIVVSLSVALLLRYFFFFFNDTATTEIYTLSLHDALPIYRSAHEERRETDGRLFFALLHAALWQLRYAEERACAELDRKSTRLNSSHSQISYAVFCLKKKKNKNKK